jgi:hypothetical protein
MRFRDIFLGIGSLLVFFLVFFSDPSVGLIAQLPFGSSTLGLIINIVISLFFVGVLHFSRKALIDYIDLETFFKKSIESSQGAGMAIIGVGLIMVSISLVVIAAAIK